jgi:hypothetical protein
VLDGDLSAEIRLKKTEEDDTNIVKFAWRQQVLGSDEEQQQKPTLPGEPGDEEEDEEERPEVKEAKMEDLYNDVAEYGESESERGDDDGSGSDGGSD